jgi:hypothetical protein
VAGGAGATSCWATRALGITASTGISISN